LACEGVDVAICARRKGPLEAATGQIARETNRKIVAIPADLAKPVDAEAFVKEAHTALGRIDILVQQRRIVARRRSRLLTEEHWAQSLQLKFMGYVRCLKHVLPIMQKQRRGRVVNLIGNDGVKPSYWEIALGAANAAGQNLTLALAAQYGKDNISFVAVNPGPVRTERWAGLVDARLIRLPRAAFRWGALANARRSPALSPTSLLIWRILLTAR
jgi:NAD(P)-dependent dehydrogenase (short-subunit alcohol dehydrogenase family)